LSALNLKQWVTVSNFCYGTDLGFDIIGIVQQIKVWLAVVDLPHEIVPPHQHHRIGK
jgi:hypothetical protein